MGPDRLIGFDTMLAVSTDILEASAFAYLSSINKTTAWRSSRGNTAT